MKFNDVNGKKFGLDDSDFKKGITTIEQKLNFLCPNYTLMDHLFGGNPYSNGEKNNSEVFSSNNGQLPLSKVV